MKGYKFIDSYACAPYTMPARLRTIVRLGRRRFDAQRPLYTAMLVVAVAHALLFLGLFKIRTRVTGMSYYELGSDTQHVYWPAVQKLLAGHIPYVDPHFFVEYPPLGTAFFLVPALLHPATLRAYDWLFAAEVLAVDLATLPVLARLARREGASATGAVAAYGLLVPLLGSLVSQRYDLVPATLTLTAILALLEHRPVAAWGLLLLATLMKLYPAVLAPLFLVHGWQQIRIGRSGWEHGPDRSNAIRWGLGLAFYGVGLVSSTLAWYLLAPASLIRFIQWETQRGIEIESLSGSLTELAHLAGLSVYKVDSYGSYNIISSLTPTLKTLSPVVTAGLLIAIYLSYAQRPLPRHDARDGNACDARSLVTHSALAVLAVLLGSKLLSIQFLLWLVPLVAAQANRPRRIVALTFAILLLSQWVYPMHWPDLWSFKPGLVLQLALRNILLVGLFVILWHHRASPAPTYTEGATP